MAVSVNKSKCIGCGLCTSVAPEVFELGDDGFSRVKNANGEKKYPKEVKEAVDSCPVKAIEIR